MTFKLIKKSETKALATLHVVNGKGDICGSINIPPNQVSDLFRNWSGVIDEPTRQNQEPGFRSKLRAPTLGKQGILRGC